MKSFMNLLAMLCFASTVVADENDGQLPWTGNGAYRNVVEVPAVDIGKRTADEMPASIQA